MNVIKEEIKVKGFTATLTGYILDNFKEIDTERKRSTILICPGGAYAWTSPREAEPIAMRFASHGFQCFVLDYSCAPTGAEYPVALSEALLSIKTIREHSDEWHVDPDRVAILGFSAGGHLAADVSCEYNNSEALGLINAKAEEVRPNAAVLCYPVISSGEFAHKDSIKNLLGSRFSPEMEEFVSLEKRVTENNPPTFLWHTFEDGCVPVQNSLLFALALREKNVTCELHVFPFGGHGLSLADPETNNGWPKDRLMEVRQWPELASTFLKNIFGE